VVASLREIESKQYIKPTMRLIDDTGMEIISSGMPWNHSLSPCSKQAIHLLERNTKVVTWLMPTGGSVKDQIPCILYKNKYYSLSLRMQKAIYRHIRLKKGFKNEEMVDGMSKLRIPDILLKEKMRTQSRFDVSKSSLKFWQFLEHSRHVALFHARAHI
jgi:hypothetical protein